MRDKTLKICVIGLGYVGLPLSLALADSGHVVLGVDINRTLVQQLNKGKTAIHEQGLEDLLRRKIDRGSFRATVNAGSAIRDSEAIFVTVGTPINSNHEPDLDQLDSSLKSLGENLKRGHIVIIKSTVSPGTTETIVKPYLERKSNLKAGGDFFLAYSPERVLTGCASSEFKMVPKIVGGVNRQSAEKAANVLKSLGGNVVVVSSPKVAEVIKLFDNIFRDVNFALGNELGITCERLGIDAFEVCTAANTNYPRNKIMVPSPGVGGSCLPKDPYIFSHKLEKLGYKPRLILLARKINEEMPLLVVRHVEELFEEMNQPIKGSKILVLGLAFKGDPPTDDVRNSPSEIVVKKLKDMGAYVVGYDPVVSTKKALEIGVEKTSLKEGFTNSSCAIVMTNHKSFFELNWNELFELMSKPAGIVDGWHMFDPSKIRGLDLYYRGVGVGK